MTLEELRDLVLSILHDMKANDIKVIDNAQLPKIAASGPIALQHHGSKRNGEWTSPPSLLQFKNIYLKELK